MLSHLDFSFLLFKLVLSRLLSPLDKINTSYLEKYFNKIKLLARFIFCCFFVLFRFDYIFLHRLKLSNN
jgi:hypothetical protein